MDRLRGREMCASRTDHMSALKIVVDRLAKIILYSIQWISRQEVAIRKCIQSIFISCNTHETLYIAIPRIDIFISYRPVYRKSIPCRALKIILAPTLCLPGPDKRFSTYLIATYPIKFLFLNVRMLIVLHKKML